MTSLWRHHDVILLTGIFRPWREVLAGQVRELDDVIQADISCPIGRRQSSAMPSDAPSPPDTDRNEATTVNNSPDYVGLSAEHAVAMRKTKFLKRVSNSCNMLCHTAEAAKELATL